MENDRLSGKSCGKYMYLNLHSTSLTKANSIDLLIVGRKP